MQAPDFCYSLGTITLIQALQTLYLHWITQVLYFKEDIKKLVSSITRRYFPTSFNQVMNITIYCSSIMLLEANFLCIGIPLLQICCSFQYSLHCNFAFTQLQLYITINSKLQLFFQFNCLMVYYCNKSVLMVAQL